MKQLELIILGWMREKYHLRDMVVGRIASNKMKQLSSLHKERQVEKIANKYTSGEHIKQVIRLDSIHIMHT